LKFTKSLIKYLLLLFFLFWRFDFLRFKLIPFMIDLKKIIFKLLMYKIFRMIDCKFILIIYCIFIIMWVFIWVIWFIFLLLFLFVGELVRRWSITVVEFKWSGFVLEVFVGIGPIFVHFYVCGYFLVGDFVLLGLLI
jgi:hypothetical protein